MIPFGSNLWSISGCMLVANTIVKTLQNSEAD
jgi:hypothetical protein